jgi:site-specific recombinase XerD
MTPLLQSIERYLEHCRSVRRLSANTIAAYENDLTEFAAALSAHDDVTPAAIRQCLTRIAENPRLSPASVKRKVASVRAFLKATDPPAANDVFGAWKLSIKAPRRLPRAIARDELKSLLGSARCSGTGSTQGTTFLCLSIMAATGIRVSELCAIRIGHVRVQQGEILVFGKGARERVVFVVDASVRKALAAYVATLPDADDLAAPLFRNQCGRALTPQCLRLRLRVLAKRRNACRVVTPHMLRHTAATLLLEEGVDIRFVQRLLGHASIATTQLYTHVADTALRKVLERANVMEALL